MIQLTTDYIILSCSSPYIYIKVLWIRRARSRIPIIDESKSKNWCELMRREMCVRTTTSGILLFRPTLMGKRREIYVCTNSKRHWQSAIFVNRKIVICLSSIKNILSMINLIIIIITTIILLKHLHEIIPPSPFYHRGTERRLGLYMLYMYSRFAH